MRISDTASSYSLGWVEDCDPRWDADKDRVFATVAEDMFPSSLRVRDRRLPGAWWRLTEGDSALAYGWLHVVSGKAVALLAVAETASGSGASGFGSARLGEEATSRGFDRVVEMRRRSYPEMATVTVWILECGRREGRARSARGDAEAGSGGRAVEKGEGWPPA
jgi:hypothetical protein